MTEILPDSRAREAKDVVRGPFGNWVPIFCANCGAPGGRVPEDTTTHAFYLCNQCYERHGAIAGTMVVPDEVFWERLNHEQKDSGRTDE